MAALGLARFGLTVPTPDLLGPGLFMFLRSFGHLESAPSVSDFLGLGSITSIRSFSCLDFLVLVVGCGWVGITTPLPDLIDLGASLPSRHVASVGFLLSAFGLVFLDFIPSPPDGIAPEPSLLLHSFS